MRVATAIIWGTAISGLVASATRSGPLSMGHILACAALVAVVTCTWVGTELIVACTDRIIAATPTAEEEIARALLRGAELRDMDRAVGEVRRLHQYRR